MNSNNIGTNSKTSKLRPELTIDEDLELDDDVRIDEKYLTGMSKSPKENSGIKRSTIAGILLLIAFFLNLLLPLTSIMLIYDAETATGETILKGEVLDYEENPIENVTVSILGTNLTTRTDSNGKYSLDEIPVGENKIQFNKEGYRKIVISKVLFSKGLLNRLGESENIIDIPSYLQNNDFVEDLEGPYIETKTLDDNLNRIIYGTVSNKTGIPLSAYKLEVTNTNLTTYTNSMGQYEFNNVTPGIVTFLVTSGKIDENNTNGSIDSIKTLVTFLFATNEPLVMNISFDEQNEQINNTVRDKTGNISGRIFDKIGQPLENVKIILNTTSSIYPDNIVKTRVNGSFSFYNVPVGIHDLSVQAFDYWMLNITNLTLHNGQDFFISELNLTELKDAINYDEDITGAYICTGLLIFLAFITLFGAISALQHKRYSLAFIGAMVGMLPALMPLRLDICVASVFCLIAFVSIVFSRNEFTFKPVQR